MTTNNILHAKKNENNLWPNNALNKEMKQYEIVIYISVLLLTFMTTEGRPICSKNHNRWMKITKSVFSPVTAKIA